MAFTAVKVHQNNVLDTDDNAIDGCMTRGALLTHFKGVVDEAKSEHDAFTSTAWAQTKSDFLHSRDNLANIAHGMYDGSDWKATVAEQDIKSYLSAAGATVFKQKLISTKIKEEKYG